MIRYYYKVNGISFVDQLRAASVRRPLCIVYISACQMCCISVVGRRLLSARRTPAEKISSLKSFIFVGETFYFVKEGPLHFGLGAYEDEGCYV